MIIPRPTYTEPAKELHDGPDYDYVRWYINCPSWLCPECGHTQFGRNKFCVYCKLYRNVETLRPADYKENMYGRDASV